MERDDIKRTHRRVSTALTDSPVICKDKNDCALAAVEDISAGGMKVTTGANYEVDSKVAIEFEVTGRLTAFHMKLEGVIIRKETVDNQYSYGIKFKNMTNEQYVQLDELIRSNMDFGIDKLHDSICRGSQCLLFSDQHR